MFEATTSDDQVSDDEMIKFANVHLSLNIQDRTL